MEVVFLHQARYILAQTILVGTHKSLPTEKPFLLLSHLLFHMVLTMFGYRTRTDLLINRTPPNFSLLPIPPLLSRLILHHQVRSCILPKLPSSSLAAVFFLQAIRSIR